MSDITINSKIENKAFMVREIQKKVGQNTKEYYSLSITRGLRTYDAKIWSDDERYSVIKSGDIVEVTGQVKDFKGNIQIHIGSIKVVKEPASEILSQLTPCCAISEEKLQEELNEIVSSIEEPFILKLIDKMFSIEEIKDGYFKRSAGAEIHHAYVRGLAEHSIEVAKNTIAFCNSRYNIKRDLAVFMALFHDIGKIYELSDFPENKYTDMGKLFGHISMGAHIVQRAISTIEGFPRDMEIDIVHGILAHHGHKDMGSPVVPMTIEAIAVHNADKASAEINAFYLAVQRDNTDSNWTEYNNIYKRSIKKS
ncbi:3'-5' exoribonuclease YhaM family protein [Clostridium sp.]|uniref:3'-5' exoribonuclease YhaM family protein n=1 Tax=Clostridium sp. TaxID=1506 RepID=UPI002FCBCC77